MTGVPKTGTASKEDAMSTSESLDESVCVIALATFAELARMVATNRTLAASKCISTSIMEIPACEAMASRSRVCSASLFMICTSAASVISSCTE